MDMEVLRKVWEAMDPQDFDQFIAENVGYREEEGAEGAKPGCYGSGDHEPWYSGCPHENGC